MSDHSRLPADRGSIDFGLALVGSLAVVIGDQIDYTEGQIEEAQLEGDYERVDYLRGGHDALMYVVTMIAQGHERIETEWAAQQMSELEDAYASALLDLDEEDVDGLL